MGFFKIIFLLHVMFGSVSFADEIKKNKGLLGTGMYFGGGVSNENATYVNDTMSVKNKNPKLLLHSGYKINNYIALEGRYWPEVEVFGGGSGRMTIQAWGVYLKPLLPINNFTLYGLMGVGDIDVEVDNVEVIEEKEKLQWGGGVSLDVTNKTEVYMDYLKLYEDGDAIDELSVYRVNFGFSYTF